MDVSEASRRKALGDESARLRKHLAEQRRRFVQPLRNGRPLPPPGARVARLRAVMDLTERRGCQIVTADRKTVRHHSCRPPDGDQRATRANGGIVSGPCTEYNGNAMRAWCRDTLLRGVISPGAPMQRGFVESSNGRGGDEEIAAP